MVTQLELRRALEDFRLVEQLLPMCSWCRKVRDTGGGWLPLHDYVSRSRQVTHGMWPDCLSKHSEAP